VLFAHYTTAALTVATDLVNTERDGEDFLPDVATLEAFLDARHVTRDSPVDLAAEPDGRTRCGAPKIEVAVLQPSLLAHLRVSVDLERQRCGLIENLEVVGDDFDLTGGDGRVDVALGAQADLAADCDHPLVAQVVGDICLTQHDLCRARGVPQIDEGDPTVVTTGGHPAGQPHVLPGVRGTQTAGVMTADHKNSPSKITCGRRSSGGGVHDCGSALPCSPVRMSLTSSPESAGNHTNGMPRRSAVRIWRPYFAADADTSHAIPLARSAAAIPAQRARWPSGPGACWPHVVPASRARADRRARALSTSDSSRR